MQLSTAVLNSRPALSWARAWLASSPWTRRLCAQLSSLLNAGRSVPVPIAVPRSRPLHRLLALAVLGLAAAAPALAAHDNVQWEADGRLIDVQVMVEGRTAPLFFAPGRFDRRYFQAFRGRNYSLVVRNNSAQRVGVLLSVDGLNVVNGERSRLSRNEAMYVLDPHERTVIRGWRTSLQDVRKFVFVNEERSYAERTGQANGDMGWIRVLAFRERWMPWLRDDQGQIRDRRQGEDRDEERPYGARPEAEDAPRTPRREAAPPSSAEPRLQADRYHGEGEQSNPGTGWGDRSWDPVNRTWFNPERNATDHLVLRYEYASGLRALGIDPRWSPDRLWERERGELGFAQPPRW
jgi:hypothetical protein